MTSRDYRDASAIARKRRTANILAFYTPPIWPEEELPTNLTEFALKSDYYTKEELQIVQSEADTILEHIRTKQWTALVVAKTFCKASAFAQRMVILPG
jgi:amidase